MLSEQESQEMNRAALTVEKWKCPCIILSHDFYCMVVSVLTVNFENNERLLAQIIEFYCHETGLHIQRHGFPFNLGSAHISYTRDTSIFNT
jgi:hypothetical protein